MHDKMEERGVNTSREHHLKTVGDFFEAVWRGDKVFELRKDDRGFAFGDVLVLREWGPQNGYSGRYIKATVTYLLAGQPWLTPQYVAMSIQVYEKGGALHPANPV
jgi:hypothetical protein